MLNYNLFRRHWSPATTTIVSCVAFTFGVEIASLHLVFCNVLSKGELGFYNHTLSFQPWFSISSHNCWK